MASADSSHGTSDDQVSTESTESHDLLDVRYPAWELDQDGHIERANLLPFFLFGALDSPGIVQPEKLLGKSVFEVYAQAIHAGSISLHESANVEFVRVKFETLLFLDPELARPSSRSFVDAVRMEPTDRGRDVVAEYFRQGDLSPHRAAPKDLPRIWPLAIHTPAGFPKHEILRFQVATVKRSDGNYYIQFNPSSPQTDEATQLIYRWLNDLYGPQAYVYGEAKGARAGSGHYGAEVASKTGPKPRRSRRPIHPAAQEQDASTRFVSKDEFHRALEGVIASTRDVLRAMSGK